MSHPPAPAALRSNFGVRLTQAEYERRVRLLYTGVPPLPTDQEVVERSQIELHMLVDYRLGVDFPIARRRRLWNVKHRLDKHPLLVVIWGFLSRPWDPGTGVMGVYARALATVLNSEEIRAFLDLNEDDAKLLRLHGR